MDCENIMSVKSFEFLSSTENEKENILNLSDYPKEVNKDK